MQHTIPHRTLSSTDNTMSTTNPPYQNDAAVSGDIATWLNDWAKSLSEQPPPTSLDDWLRGLIPTDMHESLAKTNYSKHRLNSYLNAAQKVLSRHGYQVSNPTTSSTNVQAKLEKFANVKQMYFLVRFNLHHIFFSYISFFRSSCSI